MAGQQINRFIISLERRFSAGLFRQGLSQIAEGVAHHHLILRLPTQLQTVSQLTLGFKPLTLSQENIAQIVG